MSVETPLTQDEAIERARLIDVDRYDIDVDLTGMVDGPTIRTTSTITFRAEAGSSTFAECAATVERATLNGRPLGDDAIADGRIVLRELSTTNVLTVAAHQSRTSELNGIQRSIDPVDGLVYVWMAFEPYAARQVWACFDQPDLKAPHRFTVDAPPEWTVASNTSPETTVDTDVDGAPARRWSFPDTPTLSTYVVVVDAGPFHEFRREHRDHSLGVYCRQSRIDVFEREADFIFDLTAAGLDFFGDRFGVAFPQRQYDQVFVPEMPGALENWGCVTWGDSLVSDAPTHADRSMFAEVLLHEMAHMWFGDLVTMRWWDDLWLNESFASWAAVWALERVSDEFSNRWAEFVLDRKLRAFARDTSPATHAIRRPVSDTSESLASIDMITYAKGQTVLKQLVAYVGEEQFLNGLKDYFRRHSWGNATIDDLLESLSEASGRELDGWADAWLRRTGADTLSVRDGRLHATSPDELPPRPHRIEVTGLRATDDGFRSVGSVLVEVTTDPVPLDLPTGSDTYLVDASDQTFAAIRCEPEATALLLERIDRLPDTLARAQVVAAAWDMLRTGDTTPTRFVDAATSAALAEAGPSIVEPALGLATRAARQWAADEDVEPLTARIADVAAEIADVPANRLVALRTLAETATSEEHFRLVEQAEGIDETAAVALAWQALTRRTELGDDTSDAAASLAERDPSASRRARQLAVRAAVPDEAAKQEAWDAITSMRDALPALEIARIGRVFWSRTHTDLVRPFAEKFFDAAAIVDDAGFWVALRTLEPASPIAIVEPWMIDRATEISRAEHTHPFVRQWSIMFVDVATRILRARAA